MLDMDFKSLGQQRGKMMFLNTVMSLRLRFGHSEKLAFHYIFHIEKLKVIEMCERILPVNCTKVGMAELHFSQGDVCQWKALAKGNEASKLPLHQNYFYC